MSLGVLTARGPVVSADHRCARCRAQHCKHPTARRADSEMVEEEILDEVILTLLGDDLSAEPGLAPQVQRSARQRIEQFREDRALEARLREPYEDWDAARRSAVDGKVGAGGAAVSARSGRLRRRRTRGEERLDTGVDGIRKLPQRKAARPGDAQALAIDERIRELVGDGHEVGQVVFAVQNEYRAVDPAEPLTQRGDPLR